MIKRELKDVHVSELRFENVETGTFTGVATNPFGEADDYGDVIQKGAFQKSLKTKAPKMFLNHDGTPIGVWEELRETDALEVKGRFLDTQQGRDGRTMLKEKQLDGLSIGFVPVRDKSGKGGLRIIEEIDLWEVSLVSFPAAQKARVQQVRSLASPSEIRKFIETVRQATETLRSQ